MINVIGIGSVEGTPVPESEYSNNYRTDSGGQVVVSRLNEQMAQEIAQNGKGLYVQADNSNTAVRALETELNELETKKTTSLSYSEYDEKFPFFAWILLIILIVEFLIYDKKNPLFKNIRLFR